MTSLKFDPILTTPSRLYNAKIIYLPTPTYQVSQKLVSLYLSFVTSIMNVPRVKLMTS